MTDPETIALLINERDQWKAKYEDCRQRWNETLDSGDKLRDRAETQQDQIDELRARIGKLVTQIQNLRAELGLPPLSLE